MSVELPEKLDTTNIYRVLTALGMGGCLILGVKIWSGQDDKFGDMKASLKTIVESVESSARILTDVRLDIRDIKGEQSRLRQVDDGFGERMNRLERAYERSRTRGIDGP